MIPDTHSKNDPNRRATDRWLIAGALVAIVVATGCLVAGTGKKDQVDHSKTVVSTTNSREESGIKPHDLPLVTPDAEIRIDDLKDTKVPIVGLEEEIYREMDAMFTKPEEALQDLEVPSPEKIPEP